MFHPIIIGGDPPTASRARGAKKAKVHADSPVSCLEGLIPVAEDWHTKLNLLEVRAFVFSPVAITACIFIGVWKYFYSTQSSGEHGTLYQLRNRLNHTNVVQKPSHDFNSCDDFFELIIINHVIAASLNILGMSNIQDVPSTSLIPEPHMIWMLTNPERKDILNKVSKEVVNNFIDFSFRGPTRVDHQRSDTMYFRTLFRGIRTNVVRLLHTENVALLVVRLYTKSEERARLYHWFMPSKRSLSDVT